jgi:hypothetical protein
MEVPYMSEVLNRAAVSCLKDEEAAEVLKAYLDTGPDMVLSVHPAGAEKNPQGTGAVDPMKMH